MITTNVPADWRGLQNSVAEILIQCGFSVTIEKVHETVRGRVEIDVYAEEIVGGRENIILCECKRWSSNIPQSVVHGFRTVTADAGANTGYIIALNNFQTGAHAAVANSNVRLVKWEEFQLSFEGTWLNKFFTPHLTEELDPLLTYTEPFAPRWFPELSEEDRLNYCELVEKHLALGLVVMSFSTYARYRGPIRALPIKDWEDVPKGLPMDVQEATAYGDLAAILLERGYSAIEEFRVYRNKTSFTTDE